MNNRVSLSISDAVLAQIKEKVNEISALAPFLITLTEQERRDGFKMGEKSLPFVGKTVEYTNSNPEFCPAFLDVSEFSKDFATANQLDEVLRLLRPLTQRFEDTALQAGVEAMSAALIYYGSIKTAAAKGIGNAPEIFEDLGKRFPGKSKTTKPPTV